MKYSTQLTIGSFMFFLLACLFELELIYLLFVTQTAIGAMICKTVEKQGGTSESA